MTCLSSAAACSALADSSFSSRTSCAIFSSCSPLATPAIDACVHERSVETVDTVFSFVLIGIYRDCYAYSYIFLTLLMMYIHASIKLRSAPGLAVLSSAVLDALDRSDSTRPPSPPSKLCVLRSRISSANSDSAMRQPAHARGAGKRIARKVLLLLLCQMQSWKDSTPQKLRKKKRGRKNKTWAGYSICVCVACRSLSFSF